MMLFAIDPGNAQSAVVVMHEDFSIHCFGKHDNTDVLHLLNRFHCDVVVIEMIASYGMAVGREVFETCVWIGRFKQIALSRGIRVEMIYRQEEKLAICHSPRANDSTIRKALIDRFARHDLKNGKGTKKNPDFFYGFAKDVWAAFAVGVTYIEKFVQDYDEPKNGRN